MRLLHIATEMHRARITRTSRRQLNDMLEDAHLAKDIGLPHRPRTVVKTDIW